MNLLSPAHIIADLKAQSKKEALLELTALFQDIDQNQLVTALLDRESLGSTAIVTGMALPHAKVDTAHDIQIAVGRSKNGIHWAARDGQPVHLIFLMIAAKKTAASYLQTLANISRVLKNNARCTQLHGAKDEEQIHLILQDCLQPS